MLHAQKPADLHAPEAPKVMLTHRRDDAGKLYYRINFSSVDVIQTCMRKARYMLHDGLRSNDQSEATLFGSAIHKGLEAWYLRPIADRRPATTACDAEVNGTCACARCDAIRGFLSKAGPLMLLDFNNKRNPANGIKILDHYISKYYTDPFEVVCDERGPMVERTFEFTLADNADIQITYFGTIDVILRNVDANVILVTDHKTTSTLGFDFYKRIKPNHQYTGYLLGAQQALGLNTHTFLVNGLQVAKTKSDCARQVTVRDDQDYVDFRMAVIDACTRHAQSVRSGEWAQSAPNPCSMYGGCTYHPICEANHTLRNAIIENSYKNNMPAPTEEFANV